MPGYIICTTPRSGSTLLCHLLRSSGVAGHPESWFRHQNRAGWAKDWQITRADGSYAWPDYLAAATKAATGPNGVHGMRLMWNMLGELVTDLGHAPLPDQATLLASTFGPLHYIHLLRHDRVAQAISRYKAEVSGTWHLGFEEATHPVQPTYDFAQINTYLAEAQADDSAWHHWFTVNAITPYRLYYEDLAVAPLNSALGVLAQLNLTATKPLYAANIKMADKVSSDWAARFAHDARLANP